MCYLLFVVSKVESNYQFTKSYFCVVSLIVLFVLFKQNNPVTDVVIELKSPKVQVYSARLQIDAHLTGLRYLMYHWPTISAALGITFNLIVILFIAVISWWQLFASNQPAAGTNN